MNDLPERLRQLGSGVVGTISDHHCPLLNEAADEIERLRKLLDIATKFARYVDRSKNMDVSFDREARRWAIKFLETKREKAP